EDLARWHVSSAAEAAARHDLPSELVSALDRATAEILRAAEIALPPDEQVEQGAAVGAPPACRRAEEGLPA
ncbi:MAG TPA: polyprenyl synthetase family protein, partial [Brachybacterium sp.]